MLDYCQVRRLPRPHRSFTKKKIAFYSRVVHLGGTETFLIHTKYTNFSDASAVSLKVGTLPFLPVDVDRLQTFGPDQPKSICANACSGVSVSLRVGTVLKHGFRFRKRIQKFNRFHCFISDWKLVINRAALLKTH